MSKQHIILSLFICCLSVGRAGNFPTHEISGEASGRDEVKIEIKSKASFTLNQDVYGIYDNNQLYRLGKANIQFPLINRKTVPVQQNIFSATIPLFYGENEIRAHGLLELHNLKLNQSLAGALRISTSPACDMTVKIGGPSFYPSSREEIGFGSIVINNPPSTLYRISFDGGIYSGTQSLSKNVSLVVSLNGKSLFARTVTLSGKEAGTSGPEVSGNENDDYHSQSALSEWTFGSYDLESLALHCEQNKTSGYIINDEGELDALSQAELVGIHPEDCAETISFTGPNGNNPVYLKTGEPAQFKRMGTTDNSNLPGSYPVTYGLYVRKAEQTSLIPGEGDSSHGGALITSTGLFIADEPGHYLVHAGDDFDPIDVYVLEPKLIPDYNRDGSIDELDEAHATTNSLYRFWINDDDDFPDSEVKGDDFPDGAQVRDCDSLNVDGMRDLIDFFPVCIELDQMLSNTDNYRYMLKQARGALNFVYTDLEPENTMEYLVNPTVANEYKDAPTTYIPVGGVELTNSVFLSRIQDGQAAVLLCEGGFIGTTHPLVLEVVDKFSEKVVATAELPLSISGIEDMFRFKSLRGDRQDRLDEPTNYPDRLTSGKDFLFMHGYNVNAEAGDATHAEIFKRMYQSGYKGRFWGISWFGDPPALANGHYHNAVVEAFSAAHGLRAFLQTFSTPPDMATHSLGNGVLGVALNDAADGEYLLRNYFALDAAMSLEAYGETAADSYMTYPNSVDASMHSDFHDWQCWTNYPEVTWASEWHELFANTSDHRKELTWRNRLSKVVEKVEHAYNFYSSTEEVLRVDENCKTYFSTIQSFDQTGYYAWQIQEWYKGQSEWIPETLAGGSSDQTGWGFVTDSTSTNAYQKTIGADAFYTIRPPEWVIERLAIDELGWRNSLKSDPLFKQDPEILFSESGSEFVDGLVANYASQLNDYVPANSNVPVKNRDWLLAKGFPARSRPMGSTITDTDITGWLKNYDMAVEFLDPTVWPRIKYHNGVLEWRHGDFKDVAYPYVQGLYKTWVSVCEQGE